MKFSGRLFESLKFSGRLFEFLEVLGRFQGDFLNPWRFQGALSFQGGGFKLWESPGKPGRVDRYDVCWCCRIIAPAQSKLCGFNN
jgi:hypothetical protein